MKKVKIRSKKEIIEMKGKTEKDEEKYVNITVETPYAKNDTSSILAIILKEGKGFKWLWISDDEDRFSVEGNTYFRVDAGTHISGSTRIMVFLEGISLPIHNGYIEKEKVERTYIDRDTDEEKKVTLTKIKGLKFDSKLIDMLLNRHLADEFTREHMDIPNLIIVLLVLGSLIVGIINLGTFFL